MKKDRKCDIIIVGNDMKLKANYPFPVYEQDEEELLNYILLRQFFPLLQVNQKIVLGLRLLGYTQVMISRLMNISRTSVGTLEKAATKILSKHFSEDYENERIS